MTPIAGALAGGALCPVPPAHRFWSTGLAFLLGACLAACEPAVLPRKGERIISVAPNLTELLYAAGAAKQIVAVSEFSDYPEAAKSLPRIGDAFRLDYERIVALAPTIAVTWESGTPPEVQKRLEGLGIRVVSIPTRRLDDIAAGLEAPVFAITASIACNSSLKLRWSMSLNSGTSRHLPRATASHRCQVGASRSDGDQ